MEDLAPCTLEQVGSPGGEPQCESSESPTLARADAHAALRRVLPVLERHARRLIPAHRARRPPATREDLVQSALLVALSRLEQGLNGNGGPPEWWRDEKHLSAYLRGTMQRRLKRLVRDTPREQEHPLPDESLAAVESFVSEQREDRRRARICLAGISARDLRLLARFGQGYRYERLAPLLGSSVSALAKRRARALATMRARCRSCTQLRDQGCRFVQRRWLAEE